MKVSLGWLIAGHVITFDAGPVVRVEPVVTGGATDEAICAECGHSVAPGSGRFVNRVAVLDDVEARRKMGYPHPAGGYVCAECDIALAGAP